MWEEKRQQRNFIIYARRFHYKKCTNKQPDVLASKERPTLNLLVCCCIVLVRLEVFVLRTHHVPEGNKYFWRVLVKSMCII